MSYSKPPMVTVSSMVVRRRNWYPVARDAVVADDVVADLGVSGLKVNAVVPSKICRVAVEHEPVAALGRDFGAGTGGGVAAVLGPGTPEMDSTRKSVASATFASSPMNLISSQSDVRQVECGLARSLGVAAVSDRAIDAAVLQNAVPVERNPQRLTRLLRAVEERHLEASAIQRLAERDSELVGAVTCQGPLPTSQRHARSSRSRRGGTDPRVSRGDLGVVDTEAERSTGGTDVVPVGGIEDSVCRWIGAVRV